MRTSSELVDIQLPNVREKHRNQHGTYNDEQGVTHPREVYPGQTLFMTRRVSERRFFLRPDKQTKQLVDYCLAEAAIKHKIEVHGYLVMSNHIHLDVTDVEGNYPRFMRRFLQHVAKCVNSLRGRWEAMWSNERSSVLRLGDAKSIIDKMAYTLANPAAAGLVDSCRHWPGASSWVAMMNGGVIKAKRPEWFFDPDGNMPAEVTLKLTVPPAIDMSWQAWVGAVAGRVRDLEERYAARRLRDGTRILGRRAVLKQSPWDKPKGHEPKRGMKPRVACKDKWRRIAMLQRSKAWLQQYRAALVSYRAGNRSVVFPWGTWQLFVERHVVCAAR